MKVAIIHHHLHPGGVTSVIRQQITAISGLEKSVRIQLMLGELADESAFAGIETIVNSMLGYRDCYGMPAERARHEIKLLADYLLKNICQDTLIIAHNLSLCKNPLLNCAIKAAAEQGRKVLYYCHDFAEDRPENMRNLRYAAEIMQQSVQAVIYPDMPNCRYAALTSHDVRRLRSCNIAAEHIAQLPNPVTLQPEFTSAPTTAPAQIIHALGLTPKLKNFLYPVRGIRRKNLGEFILLAAVFGNRSNWITTLPPKNPLERAEYDYWREFCRYRKVNVCFGAGERFNLQSLMNAADACFTTSIMEGFGMAFLEPWLFDRPVMGRELYVCADFMGSGIDFPMLYPAIKIMSGNGTLCDFAALDTAEKTAYISRIQDDSSSVEQFIELNQELERIFLPTDIQLVARNKQIIKHEYSIEKYGAKLNEIYQTFF